MIEDYSEINEIEAGCDCVPLDMIDDDVLISEQLPLSECVDDEVSYASYRLVKNSDEFMRDDPRFFEFRGELYERLSEEVK